MAEGLCDPSHKGPFPYLPSSEMMGKKFHTLHLNERRLETQNVFLKHRIAILWHHHVNGVMHVHKRQPL